MPRRARSALAPEVRSGTGNSDSTQVDSDRARPARRSYPRSRLERIRRTTAPGMGNQTSSGVHDQQPIHRSILRAGPQGGGAWGQTAGRRRRWFSTVFLRTAPPRRSARGVIRTCRVPIRAGAARVEDHLCRGRALVGRCCVFLDRDGVINVKPPSGEYIGSWEEFRFVPTISDWIRLFNVLGYLVVVITNQRGIDRKSTRLNSSHLV